MQEKIVVASGYFSPCLHRGHIEYLQKARELGDKLIVIVNNDRQEVLKKGCCLVPCSERIKLIRELRCVDLAIESVDEDRTVCKTLSLLHPHIFAKGGDQTVDIIPESAICKKLGIQIVDGLGEKVQSSRWMVKDIIENLKNIDVDYLNGQ